MTNNIRHIIHHTDGTAKYKINIELNDDCKNGHEDFSITGDSWIKLNGNWHEDSSGCIHEEILKIRPDLGFLVDLHSCDMNGVPMHAVANMIYYMGDEWKQRMEKGEFCKYYRITPEEYDFLYPYISDRLAFLFMLEQTDILKRWKEQALSAIKWLEEQTGKVFQSSATRSHISLLTDEQRAVIKDQIASGYYSLQAIQERVIQADKKKTEAFLEQLKQDHEKTVRKSKNNLDIKLEMFRVGGTRAVDHTIYYDHIKQVGINWSNIGVPLTPEEIENIKTNAILPDGVTYKENK